MTVDWTILTPREFEELCYILAEANGFQELRWYGKGGGDKGRDITAKKETAYTDRMRVSENWVIQCKRYTVEPPGVAEISRLLEQCREHKPDNVLIIVSNTLSPGTKDWLNAVRSDYRFHVHLWEEMDIVREIKAHRKALSPNFVKLLKQPALRSADPLRFSQARMLPLHYRCDSDEFEEIGFFILNDYGHEQNVKWLAEFIEYLRDHEVRFLMPDEE